MIFYFPQMHKLLSALTRRRAKKCRPHAMKFEQHVIVKSYFTILGRVWIITLE